MATVYNLEPQPTAKVLLTTTSGDILLELWAKQTPQTSRNFLQLCLDGYYNNTIFHRLVPGFIIQGGDPTGTGEGGEAIYDGGLFADEFHNRLKFNRRGLLGMANGGSKDDNGSQFFMTLGDCSELQDKNALFGRVVGDTIYNVVKMGEAELGDGERPLYPTRITGAEILVNPFEDMVRTEKVLKPVLEAKPDRKRKKKTGKGLLSFGGEDGQDGDGDGPVIKKAKFNTKLVGNGSETINGKVDLPAPKPGTNKSIKSRPAKSRSPSPIPKTVAKKAAPTSSPPPRSPSLSSSASPPPTSKAASRLSAANDEIAALKASMKRTIPIARVEQKKKSTLESMIPATSVRGRRRTAQGNGSSNDAQSLALLQAFKAKLDKLPEEMVQDIALLSNEPDKDPAEDTAEGEEAALCDLHFIAGCQSCARWDKENADVDNEDEEAKEWMAHQLSFEKDRLGKDLNWKRRNEEELVVIDPREKMGEIKKQQKAGRAWDRGEK